MPIIDAISALKALSVPEQHGPRLKIMALSVPEQYGPRFKVMASGVPEQYGLRFKVMASGVPEQLGPRFKVMASGSTTARVSRITLNKAARTARAIASKIALLVPCVLAFILFGASARISLHDDDPAPQQVLQLTAGLQQAAEVRVSGLGNLFIVETGRHRILRLNQDGVRIDSLGRLGNGDYQFDTPVSIDPTNELKIFVSDRNNRRIQVYDRRFQFLATLVLPQRSGMTRTFRPRLLKVDRDGRIFVYDEDGPLIYRFDSSGQPELFFELYNGQERVHPAAMELDNNYLWVADFRSAVLHRFSRSGHYSGFLAAPESVLALRVIREDLWVLGETRLWHLDRSGHILASFALPEIPPGRSSRLWRGTRQNRWISFDIRDGHAYLLDGSRLVRLTLQPEP